MSRKKRFIEKLSEIEIVALKEGYKKGKTYTYRNRCKAILLSFEGWECSKIAGFFDVSLVTVYSWFNRWDNGGMKSLSDKGGRGRKPILTLSKEEHVEFVTGAIEKSPSNVNKVLAEIEHELGLSMSKKTLKRFLKNLSEDGSDSEKVL